MSKRSLSVPTPDLALEATWAPVRRRVWLTRREITFLVLVAAAVVWSWRPLTTVIVRSLWVEDYEHYSHIILLPFIVGYLLYLSRVAIYRHATTSLQPGGIVFGLGFALAGIAPTSILTGDAEHRLSLVMLGLVVMWVGAFLLAYGPDALQATLYPFALLIFMVPLPPKAVHGVIVFLQRASAEGSAILFGLIGMPVFRQGEFIFSLPGLTIQVAEECSGIRSSLALLISGLVMAYFFLRTPWARAAFAAATIPVAIVKNSVRIVALSWLSVHVDPSFIAASTTHRTSGIPVFMLAISILAGIMWLLRRAEARSVR